MNTLPVHLQENEKTAIWAFSQKMHNFLEDNLCHLWLFGSKARGDFTVDSDLDVLIVSYGLNNEHRGTLLRMAARISLDYDTLINTHIIDKSRWDELTQYKGTLWREVQRDGIPLHELATQPITSQ